MRCACVARCVVGVCVMCMWVCVRDVGGCIALMVKRKPEREGEGGKGSSIGVILINVLVMLTKSECA